ncbi:MAG: hypothetical protein R6W92_06810 [Desulfocurvibacter africanus]
MQDIQMLETQVTGLKANLRALRDEEALLLKAQGLEEQIESARGQAETERNALAKAKEELAGLKLRKRQAVAEAAQVFIGRMREVLAEGEPIFELADDGSVFLGWKSPSGRVSPYAGLSGGEKAAYDPALAYALMGQAKNRLLIVEAAELDQARLYETLRLMAASDPDAQIIVSTCHMPLFRPEGWTVVGMTETANG